MKEMLKKALALMLTAVMVFGVCANGLAVLATEVEETPEINYVSLGDSMTNGYGLDGYEFEYHACNDNPYATSDAPGCWFPNFGFCSGTHVECTDPECTETHYIWSDANGFRQIAWDAYPNLFADYLRAKGNTVNHDQLAMAGMTSDMMRWILEFPINPEDPNHDLAMEILKTEKWTEVMSNGKTVEENWHSIWNYGDFHTFDQGPDSARMEDSFPSWLAPGWGLGDPNDAVADVINIYQQSIADANVISLCIGNGDFGNHLMGRIVSALGGNFADEGQYEMEYVLAELPTELQAMVLDLEKRLQEEIELPGDFSNEIRDYIVSMMVYTTAAYVVNFAGIMNQINKLNHNDADIILLGIIPSMKGVQIRLESGEDGEDAVFFPLGDLIDECTETGNQLLAAYVTLLQEAGYVTNEVYFAEAKEEVELIYEHYDELLVYDGTYNIVRDRFVESITAEWLLGMLGEFILMNLTEQGYPTDWIWEDFMSLSADDVNAYDLLVAEDHDMLNTNAVIEVYLGLEMAIKEASKDGFLSLEGIAMMGAMDQAAFVPIVTKIVTDAMTGLMTGSDTPLRDHVCNAMTEGDMKSALYLISRMYVGNFLGNHPTVAGQKVLFDAIVEAYDGEYTAADKTVDNMEKLAPAILEYLKESGIIDDVKAEAIEYAENLANEMHSVLVNDLMPVAESLKAQLPGLYEKMEALGLELNGKLMDLTEKEEVILKGMLADRDALVAELEALNAELATLKNTVNTVMPRGGNASTDARDAAIAELEADIAATEKEIAELDAAIAYVEYQIKNDKSGVEAIKAAIADVKANIAATEAALAEVVAAIKQLNADLKILNEKLNVLGDAADALYALTLGQAGIVKEEVVAALFAALKDLPGTIARIEATYKKVVDAVKTVETALNNIETAVNNIKALAEKLVASAEALYAIEGEKAAEVKNTAEAIHALAAQFAVDNYPAVAEAITKAHVDLKAIVLRENAKLQALVEENEAVIKAALAVTYWYCEQKGYVQDAKDLVEKYTEHVNTKLTELEEKLENSDELLEDALAKAEEYLNEKYPEVVEELNKLHEELKNVDCEEVRAQIEAAIEELEAKKAELEQKIEDVKALIEEIRAYIASVEAAIDAVKAALADVKAAADVINTDVVALLKAFENLQNALCALNGSVVTLHNAVVDEVVKLLGYCKLIHDEVVDVTASLVDFVGLIDNVPAIVAEILYNTTHGKYEVDKDSYYVSIGDDSVVSGSYADLLAEALGLGEKFTNLAEAGLTVEMAIELVKANSAEIAKADLITVGFNNVTATNNLFGVFTGMVEVETDWESMVGEYTEYVMIALEEVKAKLLEQGLSEDLADLVTEAVEAYAYTYAAREYYYPALINAIHEINPEALVVIVGAYNDLEGAVVEIDGTEIALGEYVQYLIDAANLENYINALLVNNTIYVDAPAVETIFEASVSNSTNIMSYIYGIMGGMMNPNENGHEYIKEQILNALIIVKEGILGDVNGDGKVNNVDAMLVLQYDALLIKEDELDLTVGDVDGDGDVDNVDAMLILQYDAELISAFPAEK